VETICFGSRTLFRDLSYQPGFEDHNYSDFLGRFEQVKEIYFEGRLGDYFSKGERLEPYALDAIRLTLSHESFQGFVRENPALPIKPRDYLLSKLLQYLLLSVRAAFDSLPTRAELKVANVLEQVPESWVANLSDTFCLDVFLGQLKRYSRDADLDGLLRDLNPSMFLAPVESMESSPADLPISGSIEARKLRRQELWHAYKQRVPGAKKKSVYEAENVDRSDFYRYMRGELPDSSAMSLRLDRRFGDAIALPPRRR
jgi:hypothetical protein